MAFTLDTLYDKIESLEQQLKEAHSKIFSYELDRKLTLGVTKDNSEECQQCIEFEETIEELRDDLDDMETDRDLYKEEKEELEREVLDLENKISDLEDKLSKQND